MTNKKEHKNIRKTMTDSKRKIINTIKSELRAYFYVTLGSKMKYSDIVKLTNLGYSTISNIININTSVESLSSTILIICAMNSFASKRNIPRFPIEELLSKIENDFLILDQEDDVLCTSST